MRLSMAVMFALATPALAAPADDAAVTAAAIHYGQLLASGSPADVAAAYAVDGELVLPGQPAIHGRAALTAMLTTAMQGAKVLAVDIQVDSVAAAGSGAQASDRYRETAAVGTGPAADYNGRFESQWLRSGPDWLIVRMKMQPE